MRVALILAAGLLAGGCTSLVTPPVPAADAAAVYLINYGYHASVMVPDSATEFSEYAYGDWAWFAQGKKSSLSGVRAFVLSFKAGVGRRRFAFDHPPSPDALASALDAVQVTQFSLDAARVKKFVGELDRQHARAAAREVVFNPANQMHFVPWPEHYWLFHNCNHETAEWLESMGVLVSGLHATSDFRVRRAFRSRVVEARYEPAGRGPTGVPERRVGSPPDRPDAPGSRRDG